MSGLDRLRSWMSVQWCRVRGRHWGEVGFFTDIGSFWICDNCGYIDRELDE